MTSQLRKDRLAASGIIVTDLPPRRRARRPIKTLKWLQTECDRLARALESPTRATPVDYVRGKYAGLASVREMLKREID